MIRPNNANIGGWPRRFDRDETACVERTLETFELSGGVRDSYPSQLSGGQRQRTAVARALVAQRAS